MGKYSQIEGARDVNGDVTPTTLKPIDKVEGNKWSEMSIGELLEQRSALYGRAEKAASYCPQALPAIRQGIAQLDAIISSKDSDDFGLI
jgi:hypothetical protein